jgi:hypothetical protein
MQPTQQVVNEKVIAYLNVLQQQKVLEERRILIENLKQAGESCESYATCHGVKAATFLAIPEADAYLSEWHQMLQHIADWDGESVTLTATLCRALDEVTANILFHQSDTLFGDKAFADFAHNML